MTKVKNGRLITYGSGRNNTTATHSLGIGARGHTRLAPGLYRRKPEQGHLAAGHSDGSGDGFGVALRGGGRFLGGALGLKCRGHRRSHRIDVDARHLCCRGFSALDDGYGGASHGGEGPGGGGGGGCPVYLSGSGYFSVDWRPVLVFGAGAAQGHGCVSGDSAGRFRLHPDSAGGVWSSSDTNAEQRHLPGGWRCCHRHAGALAVESDQSLP